MEHITLNQRFDKSLPAIHNDFQEEKLKRSRESHSIVPEISRRANRDTAPLSFAQQRLWFLQLMQPGSPFYNVFHTLHFSSPINVPVLKRALSEIVRRHEILRTRFAMVDNEPVQKISPFHEIPFREVDLRSVSSLEKEGAVNRIATSEAMFPFDLAGGGELGRATLVHLEPDQSVFLFSVHHIIIDGWSVNLFNKELHIIYEAFLLGRPSPLAELTLQYADFAVWQREWLTGTVRENHLNFWKKQLANLSLLQLSAPKARLTVQSYRGQSMAFNVAKPLYIRLRKLSNRHDCTLFITLLSAFKVLLFRYTAQEDIAVGCPVSGRNRTELENLIGFFVNTLVLRSQLNGGHRFNEILKNVNEVSLNAFAHQDLPFEMLVKELHPSRDVSRNPLFQVIFQLQTADDGFQGQPGKTMPAVDVKVNTAKFDLTLSMTEQQGELRGSVEFNTDLFFPQTIERMIGHYLNLLQSIVDHPEALISDLQLLGQGEKKQLLVDWNSNDVPYSKDQFVHKLIGQKSREVPEQVAIYTDTDQITYSELNRKANQLARYFAGQGIGTETLVAVCMDRSIKMVIVHLAILKCGGAFVPLDLAYPKERQAFILEDTRATFIITEHHLIQQLPATGIKTILADHDLEEIELLPATEPQVGLLPQNRCYVMYTSGSTGRPKGVELCHSGFMNLVHWNIDFYSINKKDRSLQMATPAYDAYIYELFPYLASGASVYMVDDISRTSALRLKEKVIEKGITIAFLPTALGETFLQESWTGNEPLRILSLGGEKLMRLPKHAPPFQVFNFYGPTENTVMTTCLPLSFDGIQEYPPIGRPLANVHLYILDQHLNPVPIGVSGELYIGGAGVGRGYFNRPKLTAEKFVPDPFGREAGGRLYKTGDMVRYLSNGNVDFIGRADHQVKLRGFRIELEEIEKVIREHADVNEAVAVLKQINAGNRAIVAYLSLHPSAKLSPDTLKNFLKEKLPAFMLPAFIIILDELPKSFNGKIDRKALPHPQNNASANGNEYPVAETPTEKLISGIWEELLALDKLNVEQNFFDMGGHSLMMAQVHSRLKEKLNIPVNLIDLFQYPTIRSLSKHLEKIPASTIPLKEKDDRASKQRQAFLHQKLHNKKNQ